jgi:hypothetical protein
MDVGKNEGLFVGTIKLGFCEGGKERTAVGSKDGIEEGSSVLVWDGNAVGGVVGSNPEKKVGSTEGARVAPEEGKTDGN